MEQVEKWCWVHKKACLVTGIMGLLLAPFLWPVFLAVIVQSLTIGLPIAAGICCYKYLNEKKEKTNENEQKCINPMQVMAFSGQCNTVLKMFLTAFFRCPSHAF